MVGAEADRVSEAAQSAVSELRKRQQGKVAQTAEPGVRVGQAGRGGFRRRINQLCQRRAARELLRIDLIRDDVGAGMEPCALAGSPIYLHQQVFGDLRLKAKVEALHIA